jgi:hypothetical protein
MFYCINIKAMKNSIGFNNRFLPGIGILFAIFSISNSCTKAADDITPPPPPPPPPIMNEVSIDFGYFSPAVMTVEAGTFVTWTNKDGNAESVTSSSGQFDGIISGYGSYSYQFLTHGTYPYYNRMKPNVTGKVIVN